MSREVKNRKASKQVDARLSEPLNSETPPTIGSTDLKPEYATAALNMAADFVKQKQSLANMSILGHPLIVVFVWMVAIYFAAPKVTIPTDNGNGSFINFIWQAFSKNKSVVPTVIFFGCLSTMIVFTLMSRVTETFFNSLSRDIIDTQGENVFGVDLKKLAERKCTSQELEQAKNTYIVVYRDTPVALVSLVENKILTTKDNLVMSVSTMGCRKVYEKSGIIEDLIDWCTIRTKQKYVQGDYTGKMKLLIDVYSFDVDTKAILKRKGFTLLKNAKVHESFILGKLFGMKKELWGLQFHFEKPKISEIK
ncbi:hypothetical protein ZYGR_0N01400 [Zygosaccharomyces rouxii]|uniref:ZYRO0D03608p n=2 Tax=Zygosaccharomyces rouxii TaxID=4956 RepID=C5DV38_ZYGRC|nr:uncharacterized protein ZYRO0D03608g [Zygosaccharomyces rouxii]KAH9200571.1 inorganic phosphate transporter Pho86 [Zygosaccharomyces rouxii]GAV48736.1 hypothetical protein ZYGR_0N01400 [Zygosaccharomyces rouxii]CAR27657.1 ZYRO0D03608p [Zygosaccharomyces rouxii]